VVLEDVARVEHWSYFEPPPDGGNPDYTLFGNRATLAARVNTRRLVAQGSFRYAQMLGLPRQAVGPGLLGPGPVFYAAARNPAAFQLFIKSMSLRVKDVVPRLSIEAGRMTYSSGERTAFAGRLIGSAEWTVFERAFDGVRVDYERPVWRAHASFVMPTQGAFEESANPTLTRLHLGNVSWTRGAIHVFAHHYRDTREVSARPDNSGLAASRADVNVQTLGASFAQTFGNVDIRTWGAVQRGRWYEDSHQALSASADVSYLWPGERHPTVGAGVLYASGDDNPSDGRHVTFFPLVPTTRPDLLAGTYAQMNLRDLYARVTFRVRPAVTVNGELHQLSLATPLDRWYSGTGATAIRSAYFGYSTRRSQLATGLGTYVQTSADVALKWYWSVKLSAGVIRGGDVVRRQFADRWSTVLLFENHLRLGAGRP
jgi:hypothetical protein